MSKLVVFGGTGQQGYSIITTVLAHAELSKKYSIRAITRNAFQPKALELAKQGVEVVEADVDNPGSLPRAVEGAGTVILITSTVYESDLKEREFLHCITLWGNGPVDSFDSKAEAETYLRTLPFRSAYIAPGMFMQNLTDSMRPRRQDDGSYNIVCINDPATKVPLFEAAADTGAYIVPLLKDPIGTDGKTMYAATKAYSFSEMAEIISKVSGESVRYVQIPSEVYEGFMEPEMGGRIVATLKFFDKPGYFGLNTATRVQETLSFVDGKLTTLEEFAEKNLKKL